MACPANLEAARREIEVDRFHSRAIGGETGTHRMHLDRCRRTL